MGIRLFTFRKVKDKKKKFLKKVSHTILGLPIEILESMVYSNFSLIEEADSKQMAERKMIYFIGIGGIGMSGLAQIYKKLGFDVCGSDIQKSYITEKLEKEGIKVLIGHKTSNIKDFASEIAKVVISTAISKDNPELLEARRLKLPIYHRSDLLAELFLDSNYGIAVSGSHGKTTISSMIASILVDTNRDPTCIIGGNVPALNGSNARFGSSDYLVAEADESDATFLKYFPHSAIISNIDNDHLDHYENIDTIIKAFERFASHVNPKGTIYICNDDANCRKMKLPSDKRVIRYGIDNLSDVMAIDIKYKPLGSKYTLVIGGIIREEIELSVPGKHNVLNSLAAISCCLDAGVRLEEIKHAIKKFTGAGRRFEVKGCWDGVTVIDDYGHHPSEIKATLAAAKNLGAKRIFVIFQPHRYTRTMLLHKEFGQAFADCDKLFITDIYPSSEKPIPGVTSKLILDYMPVKDRKKTKLVKNIRMLPLQISKLAEPGDVVFTLGAGSITYLGDEILEQLKQRSIDKEIQLERAAV